MIFYPVKEDPPMPRFSNPSDLPPSAPPTGVPANVSIDDRHPEVPDNRYDLRILRAIRRIIRSADQHSKRLSVDYGITLPQLICLNKIVEEGPISVKSLAQAVFLSPSTIVGIVDRLEKREYVARHRSKVDRRSVELCATESGIALARKSPPPLQDAFLDSLRRLEPEEQTTIADALERVVDLMEIRDTGTPPLLPTNPEIPASVSPPALDAAPKTDLLDP